MKRIFTLMALVLMVSASTINAQRYLEEVFDNVVVDNARSYGSNATVLFVPITGEIVNQPLIMDVYEPEGDTEEARPLILYFHTGNFIPTPDNGSPSGSRTDSTAVEICKRFARMGYVVASCDYRLGWNPIAETQDERVNTLINAAYRGVQDARTAVRWFRRNAAEDGNEFNIDPERIAMFGQGTGGYITLAAATLDEYQEVLIPKFFTTVDDVPVPMVIEQINGDIFGTSVGVFGTDTLCYPNHVGYSSDFSFQMNMGGAMGDISWLEQGDMPMVSFQAPTDPFAPYTTGVLTVPVVNLPVVEVSGANDVHTLVTDSMNNQIFVDAAFEDVWTTRADAINGGREGLFPIIRPAGLEADSSPWDYWADTNPNHLAGLQTNPDMSIEKAHAFIDTIQGYTAPRLACALNLPGSACEQGGGPANDMCADATDINAQFGQTLGETQSSGPYSNVGATAENITTGYECFDDNNVGLGGAPSLENTVWFSFTGDGQGYSIETTDCDGTAAFFEGDTQMAVYSGDCDNLVPVACSEDIDLPGGNYYSYVFFETTADTEYYILVDGYDYSAFNDGEPATGDFCIDVLQTTSNVDEQELIGLNAYPNPAQDQLTLTADEKIDFITVYNVVGEMVLNEQVNSNRTTLDVAALQAGIYIVEAQAGAITSSTRFVKK